MKSASYVMLAPVRLKEGIDETELLKASDVFQENFVKEQKGIVRRILLRDPKGGYADLVFFESKEHADRVVEAEATSEHCHRFFELFQPPNPNLPDHGVLAFEHVKTYE